MLKINVKVSPAIFETQAVKRKLDETFEETSEKFRARFEELKNFLLVHNNALNYNKISYEAVEEDFKEILIEKLATIAVEKAFSTNNHDIEKNLIEVISTELIETAIMQRTMIAAFAENIRKIETNDAWQKCLKGSMIMLLEKRYLGEDLFGASLPVETEEINDEVNKAVENFMKWLDNDIDD